MREGPPLWLHPPALAKSLRFEVDDGFVTGEIWAEGLRFFAEGFAEDDAEYSLEEWSTYLSLEECVCLCNTLATGKDTKFEEEAWGRVYPRVFSLDSPCLSIEAELRRQNIWFYPMNERRMVFRLRAFPMIGAVREILQWAEREASRVQPEVQGAQNRQIRRALELLERALGRVEK